ncbi:MAG: hypothetical protein IPM98_10250 [Lewinellaceae bacterium]|nr:hypothetical protein [Lewinellaceae bacterium]
MRYGYVLQPAFFRRVRGVCAVVFGLFEITLPSSWVNQSDKMADKGGMLGIFFMAFTLALVSFSCTGPIVGTCCETVKPMPATLFGFVSIRPLIGMTGFGLALALPFGLLPCFPAGCKVCPSRATGWTT